MSIKKSYDVDTQIVTIDFNGEVKDFPMEALPAHIITQLALHGLAQKLGDSYSGKSNDPVAAEQATNGVYNALAAGEFRRTARSGGGGTQNLWLEAIRQVAEAEGLDVDAAIAKYENGDKKEKAAMRAIPSVKSAKLELERERMGDAGNESLGSLLS